MAHYAKFRLGSFLCAILLAGLAFAQTTSAPVSQHDVFPDAGATPSNTGAVRENSGGDSAIRLGAGDLIEVSVYDIPELATKTRVSNAGEIYLPLVDYVHVSGLTLAEAETVIERRLDQGGFVKNPHVQLFVDEYTSAGASVLGEVAKPGIYPVLGDQRLFDLISSAGGFTERAGNSVTVTHRGQAPVSVSIAKNLEDRPESNIQVLPGDTISVRRADVVYVVGDVVKPSGFLMEGGQLSVLQAIALAGGANSTAKLSGARIIHKSPTGLTETHVPLKKLLEAKTNDIPMQADDILFVPTSARKRMEGRSAEAAIQMATAASLIVVR